MSGAFRKELIALRKNLVFYLIFLVLVMLIGAIVSPFAIFFPFMASVIMFKELAYDEASGWERFCAASPNDRIKNINAKYAMAFVLAGGSAVLAAVCCGASAMLGLPEKIGLNAPGAFWSIVPMCIPAALAVPTFFYPIWARFGYQKAVMVFAALGLCVGVGMPAIGSKFAAPEVEKLDNMEFSDVLELVSSSGWVILTSAAVMVIIALVSWTLSVRLYKRRDL